MKNKIYRRLFAGMLCTSLFFSELMSVGITAFAAETGTMPITGTKLQQEEVDSGKEEEHANTEESGEQEVSVDETAAEDGTQPPELNEDKFEIEETESQEEDKSEENAEEIDATEETGNAEETRNTKESAATEETDNIDENDTVTDAEETGISELSVSDDDIASGKYKNVSWVIDKDGKLTVTGKGEYTDSHSIESAPWYSKRTSIKSAEINVTDLTYAAYMFNDCSNLVTINLNGFNTANVTDMGGMFRGCSSLTDLDLSSFDTHNVKKMEQMFISCSNLNNLNLSSFNTANVTDMNSMFMECSNLTDLDLSSFNTDNVTDMRQMFSACNNLIRLDLSSFNTANVTNMRYIFYHCGNLTDLRLGNFNFMNLTTAEGMFMKCSSLTDLDLRNFDTRNVTDMEDLFLGCSSLTSLDLSSFNTANVTNMHGMFSGCSSLTNINLGSFDTRNVTDMRGMFSGCSSLTNLSLSNFDTHSIKQNFTDINPSTRGLDGMFSSCSSLSYLEFPDNITYIGLGAFSGCNSLRSITIPNSVEFICERAFYECKNLTSVILPDSITNIGEEAFDGCVSLSNIELPQNVTDIGDSAFSGCTSLSNIELPENVTNIGDWAFSGCAISSIVIPDGVTYISRYMFCECENLSSVELPNSVTYIGEWAFSACDKLRSIELPNGVTSIGEYAFWRDYNKNSYMESIGIPVSVTDIGNCAFDGCYLGNVYYGGYEDNWKEINIGDVNDGLTNATIHYASTEPQTIDGVLRSCDDCKINWKCTYKPSSNGPRSGRLEISVDKFGTEEELYLYNETGEAFPWEIEPYNIPKSAISTLIISGNSKKKLRIPTNAFKGYSNLYAAAFSNVSGVDSGAFEDCKALEHLSFMNGSDPVFIGSSAFKNCYLTQIELPDNLQSIGAEAFQNTSLKTIFLGSNIKEIGKDAFWGCKNLLIYCTDGSYAHQYALENNLPFRLSQAGVTNTHISKKEITFYGWYANKQLQMDWGWDLILKGDSDNYDNRLSKIALALSAAAEKSESDVKSLINELGATSAVSTQGFPQMTMGYKTITNTDGEKTYVFIVVCRGTSNVGDGINDALSSIGPYDWGASALKNGLNKYIKQCASENNTVINKDNIKIFMTGHSLGGASTNIVAEGLNSDYGSKNVFAYTFAAPSPLKISPLTGSKNIHNIICNQDSVPLCIFLRKNWYGYGRKGSFSIYDNTQIYKTYNELTQKELDKTYNEEGVVRLHAVDVYMAYLLTNSSPYKSHYSHGGGVWCPVDLEIYNSAGELVGSVTDNHVDEENMTSGVLITIGGENNDEKYFYFFKEDTYTIKLTGTDTGTMKYAAQYINMNTDAVISEKVFTNVTLFDGKKMTSSVSAWDKADTTVNTEDKIDTPEVQLFVLDNNGKPEKEVLPDGNGTEVPVDGSSDDSNPIEGVLPEDIPEGGIPEGLWVADIKDIIYTGKAVKPEAHVYNSNMRLKAGEDYTISYKNNIKANNASNASTAPTVVVKGKGNYTGKETASFKILPVSLTDSSVTAENLTVSYNGKIQKKAPVVTFNGKKLSGSRDYTVSFPSQTTENAYQAAGTYDILLTAKEGGNFTGTRTVTLTITSSTLINKASVKKIPTQTYTGSAVTPALTVTMKKTALVENRDYTVAYENNTNIGTATVILTGTGAYAGTKKVTFQIGGTSLKKVTITGIENKIYNGREQTQNISVQSGGVALKEGDDYTLTYSNSKNVGKATVTIKGINAYTGIVKKTFRIAPYDFRENADGQVKGLDDVISAKYVKGGSRPALRLTFADGTLREGIDYTLSYQNNKAVTSPNTKKQPCVVITGKGNFKGKISRSFTISRKALNDAEAPVTLTVPDKRYTNKAGNYVSAPVLTDVDGVKLVKGKDYENIVYTLADGTVLSDKANVAANTEITVKVMGAGAYSGELATVYRIAESDFGKAKISITPQIYTGREITLDKSSISVQIGKDTLSFGTDYEIVDGSYVDNVKKGRAKVTIAGKGKYGGMKTVRFKITAKKLAWFWRLFK